MQNSQCLFTIHICICMTNGVIHISICRIDGVISHFPESHTCKEKAGSESRYECIICVETYTELYILHTRNSQKVTPAKSKQVPRLAAATQRIMTHIYIYTCIYIYIHIYIHIYICIYKYIYMYIYVYTYICTYTHTYINIFHIYIYAYI